MRQQRKASLCISAAIGIAVAIFVFLVMHSEEIPVTDVLKPELAKIVFSAICGLCLGLGIYGASILEDAEHK